jgi:hypothetical protein
VCVISQYTKILNEEYKEHKYFGDELETLSIKDKNHSGAAKPWQSTIQKKKLVTN